jgi:hypothetical protein
LSKEDARDLKNCMEWNKTYLDQIRKELKTKADRMIKKGELAAKIELDYGMVRT